MTPALRAFVESRLIQKAETQARMQAQTDELKAQVKRLTPETSSVRPSTQQPHARPAAKPKSKTKTKTPRGGPNGHYRTIPRAGHWRIENSQHDVLDQTFAEDASRIRTGTAPELSTSIRRMALNIFALRVPWKHRRCSTSANDNRQIQTRPAWLGNTHHRNEARQRLEYMTLESSVLHDRLRRQSWEQRRREVDDSLGQAPT